MLDEDIEAVSPAAGKVSRTLVDSGYYSDAAVTRVEADGTGPIVYAAMTRQAHGRSIAQLEKQPDPPALPEGAALAEVMAHRLATAEGKALYGLRKQTVEPVFGIIKSVLGFRQFSLRGLEKVRGEWSLVTLAWNLKRMYVLAPA